MARADSLYNDFHGHSPREHRTMDFPEPENLIFLGEAVEIVYRSDKRNGGGDGRGNEFVHKFARGAKLFCDESGKNWLYIHGPKIKVEEPGIIN
jgi:hypothetical protein